MRQKYVKLFFFQIVDTFPISSCSSSIIYPALDVWPTLETLIVRRAEVNIKSKCFAPRGKEVMKGIEAALLCNAAMFLYLIYSWQVYQFHAQPTVLRVNHWLYYLVLIRNCATEKWQVGNAIQNYLLYIKLLLLYYIFKDCQNTF